MYKRKIEIILKSWLDTPSRKPLACKLKRRHAVIVVLCLILSSLVTAISSFNTAKGLAYEELDFALKQTLSEQQNDVITPDTIRQFRAHISIEALRKDSQIVVRSTPEQKVVYRAECSALSILNMSDQRLSLMLLLSAMLWSSMFLFRRKASEMRAFPPSPLTHYTNYGGIFFDETAKNFYDNTGKEIYFTPLQQRLMQMLILEPTHQVDKTSICETLWPNKPDASETLYTLIRRLKPIVEQTSELQIECVRGRAYRLVGKMSDKCQ